MQSQSRYGIASGGNWIVDRVKMVDCLPGRGMLANIRSESLSTGGAAANVLVDLARLKSPFPLSGLGVVGNDDDGRFVCRTCAHYGINSDGIVVTPAAPTSYTDVMYEEQTGDRSFFHRRGANALFGPEHVQIEKLTCRVFHLGYLLLLDRMDEPDADHGTVAAALLKQLQKAGIKTSVDVVSEESDRFKTIVPPALPYIDYLILNEIETGRATGKTVRRPDGTLDGKALRDAVRALYDFGSMELAAVHMPEGVYVRDRKGNEFSRGSLTVPEGFIKAKLGAGDAFCAGMLYGLHEDWEYARAVELGTCSATSCLAHSSATEGVLPAVEALTYLKTFQVERPPVEC